MIDKASARKLKRGKWKQLSLHLPIWDWKYLHRAEALKPCGFLFGLPFTSAWREDLCFITSANLLADGSFGYEGQIRQRFNFICWQRDMEQGPSKSSWGGQVHFSRQIFAEQLDACLPCIALKLRPAGHNREVKNAKKRKKKQKKPNKQTKTTTKKHSCNCCFSTQTKYSC